MIADEFAREIYQRQLAFIGVRSISQLAGQDWAVLSCRHESEKRCGG